MKRAPQFVIDITVKRPKMFHILKDGSKRDVLPGPKRPFVLQEKTDDLPRALDVQEIQQLARNWAEAHPYLYQKCAFYRHNTCGQINTLLTGTNTFVTPNTCALAIIKEFQDNFIQRFMDPKLTRPTNAVHIVDEAISYANECLRLGVFDRYSYPIEKQFNLSIYVSIYRHYEHAYKHGFEEKMNAIQSRWAKHCTNQYHK